LVLRLGMACAGVIGEMLPQIGVMRVLSSGAKYLK
jgi:hypothetical protein